MVYATTSPQGPGVELARSFLFVPGDRSDRFTKAAASGADVVVCDLEDSVAPAAKGRARDDVAAWLTGGGVAAVRVNSVDSPWHELDYSALRGMSGLLAVIVPKSEDPEALSTLYHRLGGHVPVIALVETALGLHRAYQLAAADGVVRLAFGAVDFALDTGAGEDDLALLYARSALVVASRAAGNAQPVDGVTLALDDPSRAGADATSARRLGFAGKLCIHPRQVPVVNAAFTPTSQAVDRARRIVQSTADGAAARVEGQMVDAPVLERARRVLREANRWSTSTPKGVVMLPLDGITVVSLEQAVAAPFATRQLADLGARVIKVERAAGDFARGYDETVHGMSSYFVWLNRGKESITLDIKQAADLELLEAMLDQADVFVQNLAPGAVARLGLDDQTLRARYPRLITCSISGYGDDGPYNKKKAYDLLVQAETGLLSVTGTPDAPAKAGISIADIAAAMYAYTGVLTALYERERTGVGSSFSVAMLDALGEWVSQPYFFAQYSGAPPPRNGAEHASIAPYGPHRAGDGAQVFIGVQNEREWAALCTQVLGRPELAEDPRFTSNSQRVRHRDQLTVLLEAALANLTTQQVTDLLDQVGIANARMRTMSEFGQHPQLEARQRWRDIDSPVGPVRSMLPPVTVAGREPAMRAIPGIGQHTSALRAEFGRAQDRPEGRA